MSELDTGITFDGFHMQGVRLHVESRRDMYGGEKLVTVSVEATVADREVSKPIPLFFSRSMPMDIWKSDPQRQVHFVRDTLRSMLMHELDECLKVDGVRVFDPHKDDPK